MSGAATAWDGGYGTELNSLIEKCRQGKDCLIHYDDDDTGWSDLTEYIYNCHRFYVGWWIGESGTVRKNDVIPYGIAWERSLGL